MDCPPVNALTVAGWFDLADVVRAPGADPAVRVVVLRAEGRGFNAGVDIKEMQNTEGFDALIGANRGCYAAFAAVYECEVPVIAAVHGFCLGGGIGLVGNADVIVAADDATFGLPEVDRGALGAATHLARLVPQHMMRAMVYTAANATAQPSCTRCGSVLEVVPARRAARRRAARSPRRSPPRPDRHPRRQGVLNGIDPVDVKRATASSRASPSSSTCRASADELRATRSSRKRDADTDQVRGRWPTSDHRGEVVAALEDGMTIGIGGWGSRRKPMALVRAIAALRR